jgi:high-affinity iron transporter
VKKTQILLCFVITLIFVSLLSPTVFAADEQYYKTWAEYAEANGLETRNWHEAADAIDIIIEHAVQLYEAGQKDEAYEYTKATYWGYYETTGFERNVMTYISGSRVSLVELQFTAFRKAVNKDRGIEAVREEGQKLSALLHEDAEILDPGGSRVDAGGNSSDSPAAGAGGAIATFVGSFMIILREGLEAILIVGAIVAYLLKSGNKRGVVPVYAGSAFAVVCSFIMAFILSYLKRINPENAMSQEIIEGAAALLAVAVLFYVSNWMVSKSEAAVWSQYIEGKVAESSARGSMLALAFTAWLAVFREGAEVILFYQPLLQEGNATMVWIGFAVGCVVLAGVFLAIRLLSVRLPLKPFFLGTSVLMAAMSVSFIGAGIKELIEGGVIDAAYHDWFNVTDILDVLGVYPLYETLIPQLILLGIFVFTFVLQLRKNKRSRV